MRRVLPLLCALLGLLVPVTTADAATEALAPVADDSPMSAAGGWVAWSERDASTGTWHLVTWHAGARAVPALAPRTVPFDVDLGVDERGRVVATYSRCAQDPRRDDAPPSSGAVTAFAARDCTLRQLDLAAGTEERLRVRRPVGALDVTPSRSGRFVAFARRVGTEPLFRLLRYDTRTRRTQELPHGRMPRPDPRTVVTGQVDAVDLGPRAVGFIWRVDGAPFGTGIVREVRAVGLRDQARLLAGNGYYSGLCGARIPASPSIRGTQLTFAEDRIACDVPITRVVQARIGETGRELELPGTLVHRLSDDGGVRYEVREPAAVPASLALDVGFCHDPARPCSLVRVDPPTRPGTPRKPVRSYVG